MSAGNPFLLPSGNVHIAFSGGRTSAMMLHEILQANGSLPDRVRVTFANTGREMDETLDFVAKCGASWGVQVTWLEYRPEKPFFEVVGHNSANRDGAPFSALIEKRKFLPNQQSRFCTQELKIRTAKRFLVSAGWKRWTNTLGIRADEPDRLNTGPTKDRWVNWYPMAAAGLAKEDVAAFWRRQPFDLRLPNYKGKCWLGNCDGCFLKSERSIAALAREYPDRAAWWERQEQLLAGQTKTRESAQFSSRYSRRSLREFVERQGDLLLSNEDALCQRDDGECMA